MALNRHVPERAEAAPSSGGVAVTNEADEHAERCPLACPFGCPSTGPPRGRWRGLFEGSKNDRNLIPPGSLGSPRTLVAKLLGPWLISLCLATPADPDESSRE